MGVINVHISPCSIILTVEEYEELYKEMAVNHVVGASNEVSTRVLATILKENEYRYNELKGQS